jgi:hypothetical protein
MSANLDQTRVRWLGSGSAVTLETVPFDYYLNESCNNNESTFENDCSSSAVWAAKRLGYPIVDIEMLDTNFYACFQEATLEYNRIINDFNIVNNMSDLNGIAQDKFENLTGMSVRGTGLPYVVKMSRQYGTEAMANGDVEVYKSAIDISGASNLNESVQTYDLNKLIGEDIRNLPIGSKIEVRRIYHKRPPAAARIYDPFSMTGMSYSNVLSELGFGAYSPATQFLMTPIFEDLERMQAIEFNDEVRKSHYSFEILGNNKLKIFPIPTYDFKLYIEYTIDTDKDISNFQSGSRYQYISDASDVPYGLCTYCKINQSGKQWIKKFFLALCKETLGRILQKYSSVPTPGGEVTLDGAELRSEANEEKTDLESSLREMLDKTLRTEQLSKKSEESEYMNKMLSHVPVKIYIG